MKKLIVGNIKQNTVITLGNTEQLCIEDVTEHHFYK
jgi:hypothetical protein